jgi:hypothetical protein
VVSDEVKEAAAAEIKRVYDEVLRMAEDEGFLQGLVERFAKEATKSIQFQGLAGTTRISGEGSI